MNKFTVVTGGNSGIGYAFAKLLAADGHNLLLAAHNNDSLQQAAEHLRQTYNVDVKTYAGDLSDISEVKQLTAYIDQQKLEVNYLINSAGFSSYGPFLDKDFREYQKMIGLNVIALSFLCHSVGRHMVGRGSGRILNVASLAGFFPGSNMAVYYATKAYVLSFSQALGDELRGQNVSVTALCPGPTVSRFAQNAGAQKTRSFKNNSLPSAESVARYGYSAMLAGKPVAIPGILNKLSIFIIRFVPRRLLVRAVRVLQG